MIYMLNRNDRHDGLVSDTSQGGQDYHQEFHPPPEGAATGVGIQEKVLPVVDSAHDQEQIQTR